MPIALKEDEAKKFEGPKPEIIVNTIKKEVKKPERKTYLKQNTRVWTLNFSRERFVKKAKVIIPALKSKLSLRSMGLTALLAVEYCSQDHVVEEFVGYVNAKRRKLLED